MEMMQQSMKTSGPPKILLNRRRKWHYHAEFLFTRKRVDIIDGNAVGSSATKSKGAAKAAKARLVAQDLKIKRKLDAKETYAKTPTISGARLMIASCNTKDDNQLSSGDFDVAYLQTKQYKPGKLVLIVYRCPFTGEYFYEWLTGVIYGVQSGAYEWKDTLSTTSTSEMGFYEVSNMESMYHHPSKRISISCHVDDPLVLTMNS